MDASSVQNDVDTGLDRVKELEAMVKKLTHENQKLLTKVQEPRAVDQPPTSALSERASSRDNEDDLVPLSGGEGEDDEWLYVSPLKPPTEENKKVSPIDWMTGKEDAHQEDGIPSLDEVRKTLAFTMDEAEELARQTRLPSGGKKPSGHNQRMQKYSQQQQKAPTRLSNGSSSPNTFTKGSYTSPRVTALQKAKGSPASSNEDALTSLKVQRMTQLASHSDGESSEGSLRVKWDPSKAAASEGDEKELDASSQYSTGEGVPRQTGRTTTVVRRSTYNVADIPTSNWRPPQQRAPAGENPLKVEWNPSMAAASPASSDEDISMSQQKQLSASPTNLKVNWKASMASSSPNSSEEDVSVPKVSWNKAGRPVATGNDNIPKVKWRASQQSSAKENPLKVKWNPSMASASSPSSEEDLSFQQTQDQRQRVAHNPLKVKWNAAMASTSPASSEEDLRIPKVNWRAKGRHQQPAPTAGSHSNPLKVKWTPNMATSSPASSEEDLSVHPAHVAGGQGSSPRSSPVDQGGHLAIHQSRYSAHMATSMGQGSGSRSGLPQAAQRNPSPGRSLGMPSAAGAGVMHRTPPQTRLASPSQPETATQGIPLVGSPAGRRLPSPSRGGIVQPRLSPAAVANTNLSRSPSPGRAKTQVSPVGRKLRPPSPGRAGINNGAVTSPQSSQLQQTLPSSVSPGQKLASGTAKTLQNFKPTGNTSSIQQTSPSPVSAGTKPRRSGLRPPSPSRKANQTSKPRQADDRWKDGCY